MAHTLITGASVGIGAEFARQLAQQGHDLVLVARRREKLDALAEELIKAHQVDVRVIEQDLAQAAAALELAAKIAAQNLALQGLINNAGFGENGAFMVISKERQMNMLQLNITTLVDLTYELLPNICKQQDAFIINVASVAAFTPGPYMTVYYASKAFVLSFSEGLKEELKGKVSVTALCPGPVHTEFAEQANMADSFSFKLLGTTAPKVVKETLAKRNRAIVVPTITFKIAACLTRIVPRAIARKLVGALQSKRSK